MVSRSPSLVAFVLAVAVLVVQARIVIGGQTWDDVAYHTEIAPPRLAAAEQAQAGRLPAWWEGSGLGVPLWAEPSHGAAYPLTWLAATPRALDWLLVAHLAWLALGVAWWSRRRGASEGGALVAGVLVATTGIAASCALRGALPALAHLPWIGWAATGLAAASSRRERARAAAALAIFVGAVALAGQLALLVDALALAAVVGARRTTWRWLVAACSAGLAIGAVQWLPAIAAIEGGAGATVHGLPLARILELVVPGSFGSGHADRAVAALAGDDAWAPSLYLGVPVIALALVGPGTRRTTGFAVALALAALIIGRGGWPAWLGAPELHVAMLAVLAAAHAGNGADALIAGQQRALRALAIAAAVTAVALAGIGGLRSEHGDLAAALDRALVDGGLGLACLIGALAIAWRSPSWRAPALLALLAAPGVGATRSTAPATSRALVDTMPEWARAGQAVPVPRRMYRSAHLSEKTVDLDYAMATLAGASAARWDIAAARSEDPARPPLLDAAFLATANGGQAFLDRYAIDLAVLPTATTPHDAILGTRAGWSLARVTTAPPAAVYATWDFASDDAAALASAFPPGGAGVRERVTLTGDGTASAPSNAAPAACQIDRWEPAAIDATCNTSAPAYAVVASTATRGWCAFVDDSEAAWQPADALSRAVALPAGAHHVRWRYLPPGLVPGGVLAALGIAGVVALLLVGRRHARPDPRHATP